MNRYPEWKESEINRLKELFPSNTLAQIAEELNLTISRVNYKAIQLGLKKSPEYMQRLKEEATKKIAVSGAAFRFKKGFPSITKGMKMTKGANVTSFKKGMIPKNIEPVGTIVTTTEGYFRIKIAAPNVWENLHVVLWTQQYGEIPEGFCIRFKDGNRKNCVLENLALTSRRDLLIHNQVMHYPVELKEVAFLTKKIIIETNHATK
jgi:hypothetical protein